MACCTSYLVGQKPTFTATFRLANGDLHDPTTVAAKVRTPSGVETEYVYGDSLELERVSTGVYTLSVLVTEPGDWYIRFMAEGSLATAEEERFCVTPSAFDNPFASP